MKIYWFVFFVVSIAWASEKAQQKITYYFKYDKVAKKNRVIKKFQSGEYTITDTVVLNQLPKPPLRREMVMNDIRSFIVANKISKPKDSADSIEGDSPDVVGQPDDFKWDMF